MRSVPKACRVSAMSIAAASLVLASCASVSLDRRTQTSGTFKSTGMAVTILGWDLPKRAIDIARDNASDTGLTNMQVEHATVRPYWGWFDWIFDIVGVRYASVSGTWGYDGTEK